MFSPRPEGRSLHKPNKMTVDRNNRSHKPKGTPEGGRYEAKNTGAGAYARRFLHLDALEDSHGTCFPD